MDKNTRDGSGNKDGNSSALQRYLERQKNQASLDQAASTDQSKSGPQKLNDFKPKFGLNSAYFMWAIETISLRAQEEFRKWQERRRTVRMERHANFETATSEFKTSSSPPQFSPQESTWSETNGAMSNGPIVDRARPLTWIHAEFGVRLVATIIDWIIIYMILRTIPKYISLPFFSSDETYSSMGGALGGMGSGQAFGQSFAWNLLPSSFFLSWTIIAIPYYGFFYSQRGASPGKMAMGLQLIDARTGHFLTAWTAIFRETIGKTFSCAIFMLGYLIAAFRYDRRAFHDLLFETVVVRVPPKA